MKQLFCISAFLILLVILSAAAAAAGTEHKPFPLQQEKTTAAAEPKKESPGFFAWLIILLALSVGIGLIIYALLTREKKQGNPARSRNL